MKCQNCAERDRQVHSVPQVSRRFCDATNSKVLRTQKLFRRVNEYYSRHPNQRFTLYWIYHQRGWEYPSQSAWQHVTDRVRLAVTLSYYLRGARFVSRTREWLHVRVFLQSFQTNARYSFDCVTTASLEILSTPLFIRMLNSLDTESIINARTKENKIALDIISLPITVAARSEAWTSSPARRLGSWVRIPFHAWRSVCVYFVCKYRPCEGLIPCPKSPTDYV
jgi:hypothetical protein